MSELRQKQICVIYKTCILSNHQTSWPGANVCCFLLEIPNIKFAWFYFWCTEVCEIYIWCNSLGFIYLGAIILCKILNHDEFLNFIDKRNSSQKKEGTHKEYTDIAWLHNAHEFLVEFLFSHLAIRAYTFNYTNHTSETIIST